MLYNNLSGYLRKKYGARLKKICIDGGFTCPNRDGTKGDGGCTYCSGRGSGEHIDKIGSVGEQVRGALLTARDDERFIAYFQNFTNTYAPVSILRERYDSALIDERIAVLSVGTRPDCINVEIADLLSSYLSRVDVWVELGLQTASDETAKKINRGYTTDAFLRAAELLEKRGIPFIVHMMVGLPGESDADAINTVNLINSVNPFGVKIHSTYVVRDTVLAEQYLSGEYTPLSRPDYVRICAECIASLSPRTVLHRITGDCPRELLLAPSWNTDKNGVIRDIQSYMQNHGLKQGSLYKNKE